jgi:hypothetical protein
MSTSTSPNLEDQLQELRMIHSTLLPGEIMSFLEEHDMWMSGLADSASDGPPFAQAIPSFRVGLEGYKALWFEIVWAKIYSPTATASQPNEARVDGLAVHVKGESLNRSEQERVKGEVKGWMEEVGDGKEE